MDNVPKSRRLGLKILLPIVLVAAAAMTARAFDTSWIASGNTLSSEKLKADFDEVQARLATLESNPPGGGPPPGTVIAYAGSVDSTHQPPAGWLLCDGTAVSRTTYAALYQVIGESAGRGDGLATFNLPDYRGLFLRGVANGSTQDPDRASRTAMNAGGNTGDAVGSVEASTFAAHTHGASETTAGSHSHGGLTAFAGSHSHGGGTGGTTTGDANLDNGIYLGNAPSGGVSCSFLTTYGTGSHCYSQYVGHTHTIGTDGNHQHTISPDGSHSHTITISNAGGSETRPVNGYVNYLIKY